ncbi:MAG: AmmeMemoRadiSam system protein B, partial [Hyphomicrobium sp.]
MIGSTNSQVPLQGEVHPAQVAGSFYPDQEEQLRTVIHALARKALAPCIMPKIAIIPHAGIQFSGLPAVTSVLAWAHRRPAPRRIVIIGPAHRYAFHGLAVHPARRWRTPLGEVSSMGDLAVKIPEVCILPEAYR